MEMFALVPRSQFVPAALVVACLSLLVFFLFRGNTYILILQSRQHCIINERLALEPDCFRFWPFSLPRTSYLSFQAQFSHP